MPVFFDAASDWGVAFLDLPVRPDDYHLSTIIGSGCAILDFDRNGYLDVMLVAQNSVNRNVAFFRQDGPGQFTECAEQLGLGEVSGAGIAVGDCDNDGWPDLYISSPNEDALWRNHGGAFFRDVTATSGISNSKWGTSACWLDYDRDGWLDLFVTNYVNYTHRPCTRLGGGNADFCTPGLFPRTTDVLFRNVTGESSGGELSFEDVSLGAGVGSGLSAGLGVTAMDFDGDNWIDVYVASDQYPNLLWINEQGTFKDRAAVSGCDLSFQGRPQGSMGIAIGDVDQNETEEVVVSHLDGESHAVYSQQGGGFYRDISRETGISPFTRSTTGFGLCIVDFDFNGVNELLTANGRVRRSEGLSESVTDFWKPYQQPIQCLSIDGTTDQRQSENALSGRMVVARGLAVGDLDRDGDPDAIVSTIGSPAIVLRNDSTAMHSGLTLRFVDPGLSGRSCPGTKFTWDVDGRKSLHTFQPCQSYMSTHAAEYYLSCPVDADMIFVEVIWPHGSMAPERFRIAAHAESPVLIERGHGVLLE
ncbi:FG-GAP repeat domain-containing protein [Fuerstiella marisgermanici]|uniref:FG-GAP repeat n=1 Tax=Fuerstiella marisgermanici TaxID=1891926 RepID=A0A1P8WF67_9PLAN|nr:VCBS repeat-containing protein [Fuerstiella marisgermanici]APZ92705.1 FG-GAP repeat [Fuerstiella marisgermanici]